MKCLSVEDGCVTTTEACGDAGSCLYKPSREEYLESREVKWVTVKGPDPLQLDAFALIGPGPTKPVVRVFESGANRDVDTNKLDYEGFLSPLVLERFAEYMHKNRFLRDGTMRDSDNWQKGIPIVVYMKSMWRHFMSVWKTHRKGKPSEEDLCALLFNVQGMLHEVLKEKTA